jgi:hypothetical protein
MLAFRSRRPPPLPWIAPSCLLVRSETQKEAIHQEEVCSRSFFLSSLYLYLYLYLYLVVLMPLRHRYAAVLSAIFAA